MKKKVTNTMKLHPHLKHFIKTVVLTEMNGLETGVKHSWKESLFLEFLQMILNEMEGIKEPKELAELIGNKRKMFDQRIMLVMDSIEMLVKQIPFDVLKKH